MKISYFFSKLIKIIYLPAIKNSTIDKTAKICSGSHVVDSALNRYSYIGNFCTIINSEIGQFCSIADNSIIGGANHPIDWVSSSPVFHQGKNIMNKNFATHEFTTTTRTRIGNDVWIGSNCLIKSGIVIGDGAVIGMGSVVTKDIGPYEIWAGNPARLIKKRFSEHVIEQLLKTKWWELENSELAGYAKNFNDIDEFLKVYVKGI